MAGPDEVEAALRSHVEGSPPKIDLAAAAADQRLAGLAAPLALLRAQAKLEVREPRFQRTRDAVELSGAAEFALPGQGLPAVGVTATLRATEPKGIPVYEVSLAVVAPVWRFGQSFATLPHTLRQDGAGPSLEFGESTLAGLEVENAVFTARGGESEVQLTGRLRAAGDLARFEGWVHPWPLALEGTATLPQGAGEAPELDLWATVPESAINLAGLLTLSSPGFAVYAAPDSRQGGGPRPPFSELELVGTVTLPGESPIHAQLSAPVLVSGETWRLLVEFESPGPSVVGGLAQVIGLFGPNFGDLPTPPALGGFETFKLATVEVWANGSVAAGPSGLDAVGVTIVSDKVWEPPIPFLKVKGVGTRWLASRVPVRGEAETVVAGSVFGSFVFQNPSPEKDGIVDVVGLLPSFVVRGQQRENTKIDVVAAFQQLLDREVTPPDGKHPKIVDLSLYADPAARVFEVAGGLDLEWRLPFLQDLVIVELSFEVLSTQSAISGGLGGRLRLRTPQEEGEAVPTLALRAEAPQEGGWIFSGGLEPGAPLSVKELFEKFHVTLPDGFGSVRIERLDGSIEPAGGAWTLAGAIAAGWSPELFGVALKIAAGVEFELERLPTPAKPQPSPSGWVEGRFSVNRFALSLRQDVGVDEPTYAVRLQWGDAWLLATTSWTSEKVDGKDVRYQVLAVQLGGVTLGDVLEEIVNLAAPTLGFSLEPPWDVLKRIELSRFVLTVDLREEKRKIALTYAVDADLVLLHVDTIGVSYTMGDSAEVDLIVTGRFLDKEFGRNGKPPLSWDVVNDPPPAVPGKGPRLLELRYLGLGQRVRLAQSPETVSETMKLLREEMLPPKPGQANPLEGRGLVFDDTSEWLLGIDLRLLETVEVALIFNDPHLYGISVSLDGERAGSLAGLRFEILYKQLAPGLGMFRGELQIPEAFRHIELGEVAVTLGLVVVEVYTNGNFLVDLGFPHERDYQRSFTVEVFPFVGRGGIYFGVLNGMTSRRVPAIADGTFSPVLELGVGLAVGVGKEISVGPLSGGAYVELEAIFQGVLAWYHPPGSDAATDRYHWAKAVVALHGKVWGEVDFFVVKASISLEAYAQATAVFESYRATRFELQVHVEAEAEIEIFWITTSFSFDVDLDLSFTVGSDQPTPWTLARSQAPAPAVLRQPRLLAAHQAAQAAVAEGAWRLSEDPAVFTSPRQIKATMLPTFSLAGAAVTWEGPPPEPVSGPAPEGGSADGTQWRMAFPLFIDNGISTSARTAAAVAASVGGESTSSLADLVEGLLRWSLTMIPQKPSQTADMVTAGELERLAEAMATEATAGAEFSLAKLKDFFAANFRLKIEGNQGATQKVGATAFPPPPWLVIDAGDCGRSDLLNKEPKIGPHYQRGAAAYMAQFSPAAGPPGENPDDDPTEYESFAAHAFRDWCLMVAREAVRQAGLALRGTTVAMAKDLTLTAAGLPRDQVSYTVRPGDTVTSVAAWLGAGVAELEELNPTLVKDLAKAQPGEELSLAVGVGACTLALDNADLPLAVSSVTVKKVRLQVRSEETLRQLAERAYGAGAEAKRLLDEEPGLASSRRLLRARAPLTVEPRSDLGSDGDLVAATGWVRYQADVAAPNAEWYAQTIAGAAANEEVLKQLAPGQPIPAGKELKVPPSFGAEPTATYVSQVGDTLLRIGATLSLAHAPGEYENEAWKAFRAAVIGHSPPELPATEVALLPGESLQALAERLLLTGGVIALLPHMEAAKVLDPLAVIELPSVSFPTATHGTLAKVAAAAGLTVEALAARPEVTAAPGLFAAGTQLAVKHLPAGKIGDLVKAVRSDEAFAAIAAQASRNLLSGVRLPAPEVEGEIASATGPLTGLAELAGWQLTAPQLGNESILEVTVTLGDPAQSWIELPSGKPLIHLGSDELKKNYPSQSLTRVLKAEPRPIPLSGSVPRTYGLDHRIVLQAAVRLAVPSPPATPPAGSPVLWSFPSTLIARARAQTTIPYEILRSPAAGAGVEDHDPVPASTFGTLVGLRVRAVAGREGVHELIGADGADRELLRELALYARGDTPTSRTSLYLGIAPVPGAKIPNGLALLASSATATFAVRANMATETHLSRAPETVVAPLEDASRFLQLLWEGTVAESGYHLAYATAEGQPLPAGAFADDGTATLWLLAIPRGRDAEAPDGRTLLPTDNCAIVADGIDSAAHSLYVEAHNAHEHEGEMTAQALVPAGAAGVSLTVRREKAGAGEAEARLARLLSLLVSKIEGTPYCAKQATPAAPPQREDGSGLPRWRRQRRARAARLRGEVARATDPVEYWRFDQVVQLSDFGPASVAPAVPGLPKPERDPYRGFGAATALPKATFSLGWADVLGNVSAPSSGKPATVPIGYVDPLLGPGAWPGATTSFGVAAAAGSVAVNVTVAAQPGVSAVAPAQGAKEAAEAAEKQAERYAEAYFQLAQPTVEGFLVTTLRQTATGAAEQLPLEEKVEPLWRFTAAAYLYAAAAATLQRPSLAGVATVEALAEKYGVPAAALAAANAGLPFAALARAGKPVKATARLAFTAGDSAKTLLERAGSECPGLIPPAAATELLETADNTALRLRPGAVLATAEVSVSLPADARAVTLKPLAEQHQTTPAQLAIDCAGQRILRPGFSFEAGGQVVEVSSETGKNSFEAVREAFAAMAIDVAISELAGAALEREGLFADAAQLSLTHAVAAEGQTLAGLAAAGRRELAVKNAELADVFPAGTMVSLGSNWRQAPAVPSSAEALEEFAGRHASTAALVLAENPALELAGGEGPIVPGVAVLPTPGSGPVPAAPKVAYTVLAGDALAELAVILDADPPTLAAENENIPGLLVGGRPVTVTVGGSTYHAETEAGDTLATLTARLRVQSTAIDLAAVATAIAADATILAAGAQLVTPPPRLAARPGPGDTNPGPLTQAEVEAAYGIDAVAFAQANAMIPGLLPAGIALTVPGGTPETTRSADSLNAVLQRLAAKGLSVELRELLEANRDLPMFAPGVRILLPPKPVGVSASLGAGSGPFAKPVFPLSVTLRLQRTEAVVLKPTPGRDSPAERSDTPVPAPLAPPTEAGEEGAAPMPETLDAFVDSFEAALPGLRLGTARVEGETADLWVVDFTAGGIEAVEVKPTVEHPDKSLNPRYLALRPLYRSLQSRDLELSRVDPATGKPGAASRASFQGVDVEDWARRFLADLDLFVSAPYAAAIHSHGPANALEELLAARWKLCGAIADGLAPVLALEEPAVAEAAAAAARELARLAGSGLAAAYDVSTVLQYDATVKSAYAKLGTTLKPARLLGGAVRPATATVEPAEYSLTRAATPLEKTSPFVSFAMTVPDPAHRKQVATKALEYAYDSLEFEIDASAALEGYLPSNRVSLVRPLVGEDRPAHVVGDLGSPTVPVPLRAHPAVPLVIGQTAEATHQGKVQPTLAEAAKWTYGLTYSHEHAEQDEVLLTVTFNVAPLVETDGGGDSDLAASLAKYALQADLLRDLMSWYVDPPSPAPAELAAVREHVAGTVAALATEIASAWEDRWPALDPADVAPAGPQANTPPGETYHLRTEISYVLGGNQLAALTLRLDGTTTEPGPGNAWPAVWVRDAGGKFVQLQAGKPESGAVSYTPPAGVTVEVEGWPVVRLEWPRLNVAAVGNAQTKLAARRNQELLPGLQTNADFVLTSADVTAPDIATPLLEWSGDFAISGSSFAAALKTALTQLFEGATNPYLTVSLAYAHQLVKPAPGKAGSGLRSVLPCALYPHRQLSSAIADAVAAEAQRWQARHRPAEEGGEWLVSLTLTSWLGGSGSRPLLTLETLSHPLVPSSEDERR